MLKPRRIQLSRKAGWRMPPNTVKVDRATRWGNSYRVGIDGNAAECVALYRKWLFGNMMTFMTKAAVVAELRGKNLACWCSPDEPCHADVLLELANAKEPAHA